MDLSNDDVRYVEDSVDNVVQNIIIGAILAALVLFLYLRSPSATLIGMSGILGWVLAFARIPQLVTSGLLGVSDIDLTWAYLIMLAFMLGLGALCLSLLRRGVGLRS